VAADTLLPHNLDESYQLGCDVGNRTDAYQKLCFKFYPKEDGNYNWIDEQAQTEIRFCWKEEKDGVLALNIEELTKPIALLLPEDYQFDPDSLKTAGKDNQILELEPGQNIRVLVHITR